ncbi:glucan endo-1,3-beta-glucosidase-like [Dioscorea cayenensis subsp. rotundata]|uniref:glucan endo-1,3-beta-D-glucosidase n=1 Tax=Dioscorea cayennensis subsp. rotundata TaxID=55577 RepID=A0AB40CWT7_DIOCR|nr:glucan endo-1,3-beta-glucosidase-like [Dioscorea cayenensis subsp. rotundata]
MAPLSPAKTLAVLMVMIHLFSSVTAVSIGVNYGAFADNLPPPAQVATFIKERTYINRVKLFDCNPDFIRAFAGTGISLMITAPNGDIPSLANATAARAWVAANVAPFYPATDISLIAVGNEIMATSDKFLIARLVPAMRSLSAALSAAGFHKIRVSTPHSLGILSASEPPSSGRFRRGYDRVIFGPMLKFHRETKTPFIVNPYPYFGYTDRTLDYALFRPNPGKYDPATGINYTNMFDAQLDAVYAAMNRLGYGDVEIAVGETGWPSMAEPNQAGVSVEDARSFNLNLIRKVNSGKGTPRMPNRTFETYIFSLFNEDLKPGPIAERNFGLFRPDLTPVYDVGILRGGQSGGGVQPSPTRRWCVAQLGASNQALQDNIDYACSNGADCKQIEVGGACFEPNTLLAHASFAMNSYFQKAGRHDFNCDFSQTGVITATDPSYGTCKFSS